MKIRLVIIILFLSGLLACGGSKKVQQEQLNPAPEWIKSRPSSQTFYYGIGTSRKTLDANQYMQGARQNALADMASEISVSISSNSVLHSFESNLNFNEDFSSTIRARAQQDLEGYEMVDSWEDDENYWVFYKLSKAHYQEIKEKRKSDAITQSLNFYDSAIKYHNKGNFRLAIVQLIKALNPIKPYFSEPITAEFNGKQIYLGAEIVKEITHTLNQLKIVPVNKSITVKLGNEVPVSQLQFMVTANTNSPVQAIPLLASYSEKPIRNNKQLTNANGIAEYSIDAVRSKKNFETFSVIVDIEDFLKEANADPLIRKLINRFTLSREAIRINIEKLNLAIISSETMLGEQLKPGILESSFKQKAIEAGYIVKTDNSNVDYTVRIAAVINPRKDNSEFKTVSLGGQISVENKQGVKIYQKSLEGFIGRNFNHKQAAEDAFGEARRRLENTFFREIQETISKR